MERALLPYLVISQTIPIIVMGPLMFSLIGYASRDLATDNVGSPRRALGVFLAFFPVALGTLRGLQSAQPAALELMDSLAVAVAADAVQAPLPERRPVHRAVAAARRRGGRRRRDRRGDLARRRRRRRAADHRLRPRGVDRSAEAVRRRVRRRRTRDRDVGARRRHRPVPAPEPPAGGAEPRAADGGHRDRRGQGVRCRRRPACRRAGRRRPRDRQGRVHLADRTFGMRQVDPAPADRRSAPADERRAGRQRQDGASGAARPGLRHGVPAERPVRVAQRGAQHRAPARAEGVGPGAAPGAQPGDARARQAAGLRHAHALAAVRRHAAAASRSPGRWPRTRSCC